MYALMSKPDALTYLPCSESFDMKAKCCTIYCCHPHLASKEGRTQAHSLTTTDSNVCCKSNINPSKFR